MKAEIPQQIIDDCSHFCIVNYGDIIEPVIFTSCDPVDVSPVQFDTDLSSSLEI